MTRIITYNITPHPHPPACVVFETQLCWFLVAQHSVLDMARLVRIKLTQSINGVVEGEIVPYVYDMGSTIINTPPRLTGFWLVKCRCVNEK